MKTLGRRGISNIEQKLITGNLIKSDINFFQLELPYKCLVSGQ